MTVYRLRGDGLIWRSFDDEGVVLDVDRSLYLGTNETATALWPRLREGATREQLVEALTAEFDVEEDVAGGDVDAFIAELRQHGLLQD